MVAYHLFDGKPVSTAWWQLLTAARADGVRFRLRSGHRTMSEQLRRYRHYLRYGWPIAARPSPRAPHIRVGSQYHAVDVEGAQALIDWARRQGITLRRTVRGEPWHVEGGGFLGRFPTPRPTLRVGAYHPSVQTVKAILIRLGYRRRFPFSWRTPFAKRKYTEATARAVRAFQREHGLAPDGIIGPATWAKLLEVGT